MPRVLLTLLLIASQAAWAQIGLPQVRLPTLPQLPPPNLTQGALGTGTQLDPRALEDARRLRVRDLIRRNRAVLEADPNGEAIVRGELIVVSPSDAQMASALAAGFTVLRTVPLDSLGARLVVLQAPPRMATRRALARLRTLEPTGSIDFNHLYFESGAVEAAPIETSPAAASDNVAPSPSAQHSKVGLIDSGVDSGHAVFQGVSIEQHGCASPVPASHGTEVASLMVGHSSDFHGAAEGAALYAADVFCGKPTGGAVDALADALAWLVRERVPVINVSLVGPPNSILEAVVRLVLARGHVLVAAVGNDGPAAPPQYPASYPGVVGVTAVDAHRHLLFEAARGPQVKFAAPGADMCAAKTPQGFELVRGTSFAAPIVAALLSEQLHEPDKDEAAHAIEALAQNAIALGRRVPNPDYGYGLVGADLGPAPRLASRSGH